MTRENSYASGVGGIFDRVLIELVSKMKRMTMDKIELGCLRAIVLFNPDVKGLQDINRVEQLRERVYATLEEYTRYGRYYHMYYVYPYIDHLFIRAYHENEPGRFGTLLLRLPSRGKIKFWFR